MSNVADQLNAALAGRYTLTRELGRGGMATVYLAEDLRHRRPVAIKVLDPEIAAAIGHERFLREIEIAGRLTHPHITPLHDSGAAGGLLYYVMPYVEGETLRARLQREKRLPVPEALRLAREVAGALDYAHKHGVIHRDIKPENILLASGQAMVADFGIARALRAAGAERLTTTGAVLGTPLYMSPEQVLGSGELDGRTDLYSLACVVYEMLAGQPPFTGPVESVVHQHMTVVPRLVTELRPSTPAAMANALARALAKVPADRFATAGEFVEALEATARTPAPDSERVAWALTGASGSTGPRANVPSAGTRGRAPTRFPLPASIIAIAALLLAGFGVWKGPGWLRRLGHRDAPPAHKEWILVAEFEGADSSTASAARDLVSAAIDESRIAMTVPRDQIRLALAAAGKPPSSRLTPEVAREIAFRSSVRTVLEGRVGRVGKGFALSLELDDVDSSRVLFRASETAKNEDDLIRTVDRLGRRLRETLGENRSAIRATRELRHTKTGSLEALKLSLEAVRLLDGGYDRECIVANRAALALDPEFATCWYRIGIAYQNLADTDSATVAYETALRHPQRLSEPARLGIEASLARERGDFAAELSLLRRAVELNPDRSGTHNNLGIFYFDKAQFEEALAEYRQAMEVSRFGPNQTVLFNLWLTLLTSGRTEEALRVSAQFKGWFAQVAPIYNALVLEQWTRVENLAEAVAGDLGAAPEARYQSLTCLASVQSARGAMRDAGRSLERAEVIPATIGGEFHAAEFLGVLMSRCSGLPVPPPGPIAIEDSSLNGARVRGIHFAAAGDTTRARQLWHVAVRRIDPPNLEGTTALLEALIVEPLDPRRVVDLLAGAGRTGMHEGRLQQGPARAAAPWLVAEAFEKLGERDSAAAYYERALDPYGAIEFAIAARVMASSFAHQRLVMLYLRLGRIEDARRHWDSFRSAFTRPDPECGRSWTRRARRLRARRAWPGLQSVEKHRATRCGSLAHSLRTTEPPGASLRAPPKSSPVGTCTPRSGGFPSR